MNILILKEKEKGRAYIMQMIKYLVLFIILGTSTYIGIIISKKYSKRVNELKEIKSILNILSTQIKFTYEPLHKIFSDISSKFNTNVGNIFKITYEKMDNMNIGDAWNYAVDNTNTNFTKEDRQVLKGLSNMLGKVDVEGQLKEIKLVDNFLDMQIDKAEQEKRKNEKLYKTLGVTIGMTIVIILI